MQTALQAGSVVPLQKMLVQLQMQVLVEAVSLQVVVHVLIYQIPMITVNENDTRQNWPHFYFTRICNCSSNYGGYDCGECAFGYRGPNCDQKYIRQRRSTSELTDEEWRTYISQLRMAKSSTTYRYRVIISPPDCNNLAELQTVPIGVYHSFIWFHHYVAKDTPCM